MVWTHPSVTPGQRRASLLLVSLSALPFLFASYLIYDAWRLTRTGVVATGKIVALDSKRRPTVRFMTVDGRDFTIQNGGQSFTPFGYAVGDDLNVVFRPDRPQDACIAGQQWGFPVILTFLAFGFGYFGLAGLKGRAVIGPLHQRRTGISLD